MRDIVYSLTVLYCVLNCACKIEEKSRKATKKQKRKKKVEKEEKSRKRRKT